MKKLVLSIVCCICFTSLFSQSLIRSIKVENPDDTDIYFPSSLVDSITFVPVAPGQYQQAVWTDGNATLLPLTSKIKVKAEESKDGMIVITDNENFDFLAMTASNHIIGLKKNDENDNVCIIDTLQVDGQQDPILIYGDSLGHAQRIIYDYLTMDILYKEDNRYCDIVLFDGIDTIMVKDVDNPYFQSKLSRTRAQSGREELSPTDGLTAVYDIIKGGYEIGKTVYDSKHFGRYADDAINSLRLWNRLRGRYGAMRVNETLPRYIDALTGQKAGIMGGLTDIADATVVATNQDNYILRISTSALSTLMVRITAPHREYPFFSTCLKRLTAGEIYLLLDAVQAGIDLGQTINSIYEDYVAEMLYGDSWPVTGDCVHLGKRYVALKTHVPIVRSGSSFKVGAMLGDTRYVSQGFWRNIGLKNYIEKQSVDVRYNSKDSYHFIFEIDPTKKDYRYVSILEPADESEFLGHTRAYDFFRYGSQTKNIEPGNSCVEFTVKQTSVRHVSGPGSDYIFAFDVVAQNQEADLQDWGCALYRDNSYNDRLDLQRVSKENFTGEVTFNFEVKVYLDEKSNVQANSYEICPYTKIEETVICDPEYDAEKVNLKFDPNVKIFTDGYKAMGNNQYYLAGKFSGVEKYDAIGFCYFTQNSTYADALYSKAGNADGNGCFGVELQMKENTSYSFCAYIEIEGCKYFGELVSIEKPTVETVKHEKISDTSYRLYGSYSGYDTRKIGFVYNTTGEPTIQNGTGIDGELLWDTFTAVVDNLNPGTTYFYRAFVNLDGVYIYGETKDFETEDKNNICPDNHHPHMIDLGLSSGTKWSCCNLDAGAPHYSGGYYAWGETERKGAFFINNYEHAFQATAGFTDEAGGGSYYQFRNIGSEISGSQYDAVKHKMGNKWSMPTIAQMKELASECTVEKYELNGVLGVLFTSKVNDNKVFLPMTGDVVNNVLENSGYWSGTIDSEQTNTWSSHYYYPMASEMFVVNLPNLPNIGPLYFKSSSVTCGRAIRPVTK